MSGQSYWIFTLHIHAIPPHMLHTQETQINTAKDQDMGSYFSPTARPLRSSTFYLTRGMSKALSATVKRTTLKNQKNHKGQFSPIGNSGWHPRNGEKSRFDQQPLEAESIIEACIEAFKVTQDKKWIIEARHCLEWFLGRNDLNTSLYNYKTGGCYDALTPTGPNLNQGAESTLAWLLSLLNMYLLDNLTEIDLTEKLKV